MLLFCIRMIVHETDLYRTTLKKHRGKDICATLAIKIPRSPMPYPGILKICSLGYDRRTTFLDICLGESPRTLGRNCPASLQYSTRL